MNILTGDELISICSETWVPGKVLGDVNGKIVFVKTDYFNEFIEYCKNNRNKKVIALTHDSDGNIQSFKTERIFDGYVDDKFPENILHVFSQNCNIKHDKFTPIPIGMENEKWHQGEKFKVIKNGNSCLRNYLLYINCEESTNKIERNLYHYDILNFATKQRKLPYVRYVNDMRSHKFTLCPAGNGIDTHRFWEALWSGSFPVVLEYSCFKYFKNVLGMPIVVVDSWVNVTIEKLIDEYKKLSKQSYNELLYSEYWKKLIINKARIVWENS